MGSSTTFAVQVAAREAFDRGILWLLQRWGLWAGWREASCNREVPGECSTLLLGCVRLGSILHSLGHSPLLPPLCPTIVCANCRTLCTKCTAVSELPIAWVRCCL